MDAFLQVPQESYPYCMVQVSVNAVLYKHTPTLQMNGCLRPNKVSQERWRSEVKGISVSAHILHTEVCLLSQLLASNCSNLTFDLPEGRVSRAQVMWQNGASGRPGCLVTWLPGYLGPSRPLTLTLKVKRRVSKSEENSKPSNCSESLITFPSSSCGFKVCGYEEEKVEHFLQTAVVNLKPCKNNSEWNEAPTKFSHYREWTATAPRQAWIWVVSHNGFVSSLW